ncbi:lipid A deacylase LpxR family protein [Maribacter sp. ACAM166]|nr:lipid A deacylase LpxR family protein [Maribacter sp. ACAM166]
MKLTTLLLLVLPIVLLSQKINNLVSYRDMGSESYFRFHYDNDFFSASDQNYTQGYSFEFANPIFKKNPINYIFIKPTDHSTTFGVAIEHIGYTPSDFVSPEIQTGDRPFAAAIYLRSFFTSIDMVKKRRLSQSLSLGLIGPAAFGKEMQTEIHKLTGNKMPGGWDNQIQNDVVLNYNIDFEKQLYRYNDLVSLQSVASIQLGTLFTNAAIGFNTSFGVLDAPFSLLSNSSAFKIYAYAQPVVSVVGYDATLQGGIFTTDNPYFISSKNVESLTAQVDFGLILKYNKIYLEYTRTSITREFRSGQSAKWGGFKVGYLFH